MDFFSGESKKIFFHYNFNIPFLKKTGIKYQGQFVNGTISGSGKITSGCKLISKMLHCFWNWINIFAEKKLYIFSAYEYNGDVSQGRRHGVGHEKYLGTCILVKYLNNWINSYHVRKNN